MTLETDDWGELVLLFPTGSQLADQGNGTGGTGGGAGNGGGSGPAIGPTNGPVVGPR